MQILVTDLTRMQDGHICAAGIDLRTRARIRPVAIGRLDAALLCTHGGILDIGRVVDLGACSPIGSKPEVEDVRFSPGRLKVVKVLGSGEFMSEVARESAGDLGAIGPELLRVGDSLATLKGRGNCSLVFVKRKSCDIVLTRFGKIRLKWEDGVWLSVTDVRLYERDLKTPSATKVGRLRGALADCSEVVLAFGLGRAWPRPGDSAERHYLQLNNVHVVAWPEWHLCPD